MIWVEGVGPICRRRGPRRARRRAAAAFAAAPAAGAGRRLRTRRPATAERGARRHAGVAGGGEPARCATARRGATARTCWPNWPTLQRALLARRRPKPAALQRLAALARDRAARRRSARCARRWREVALARHGWNWPSARPSARRSCTALSSADRHDPLGAPALRGYKPAHHVGVAERSEHAAAAGGEETSAGSAHDDGDSAARLPALGGRGVHESAPGRVFSSETVALARPNCCGRPTERWPACPKAASTRPTSPIAPASRPTGRWNCAPATAPAS